MRDRGGAVLLAGVVAVATTPAPATLALPAAGLGAEPRLEVSATTDLDADGQVITVTGSGYDESKGIYVALCVQPPPGEPPSPCLGGADTSGEAGSSAWVSSNPPPYGAELAQPYEPGGRFTVDLTVRASDQHVDCRETTCGIATRADHTRSSDRTQDVFVPVTFAGTPATSPEPTPSPTPAPTAEATPSPTPVPDPTSPSPASTPSPTPTPSPSRTATEVVAAEAGTSGTGRGLVVALGVVAVGGTAALVGAQHRRRRGGAA